MQELISNDLPITEAGSSIFKPIIAVGGVMLAIGVIVMIAGIALAVYLKKKSKQ